MGKAEVEKKVAVEKATIEVTAKKVEQQEKEAEQTAAPAEIEKKIEVTAKKVEEENKVAAKEKKPVVKINKFDGLYHYDDKPKGKRAFPDGGDVHSVNNRL